MKIIAVGEQNLIFEFRSILLKLIQFQKSLNCSCSALCMLKVNSGQ